VVRKKAILKTFFNKTFGLINLERHLPHGVIYDNMFVSDLVVGTASFNRIKEEIKIKF
jgi:hypothetical protein